jgi:hypothetical protein
MLLIFLWRGTTREMKDLIVNAFARHEIGYVTIRELELTRAE